MSDVALPEPRVRRVRASAKSSLYPRAGQASEKCLRQARLAIETALSEHYNDFRRYLVRRVGDLATADDILQSFCVRVLKPNAPLRNNSSAVAWLYVVLKSVLMDHFRRETSRRRSEANYAEQQVVLGLNIVEEAADGYQCCCVKPLIGDLRSDYAQILTRVDIRGESRESLARELKINPENLRVRLHRARRAIFKALKSNCGSCCATGFDDCYGENSRPAGAPPSRRSALLAGRPEIRAPQHDFQQSDAPRSATCRARKMPQMRRALAKPQPALP